jgi:hypothetical protein
MGVSAFKVEAMTNNSPDSPDNQNQKIYQFLECMIPNAIGLYVDGYLGCGLSLILLLWHWQTGTGDRSPKPRLLSLTAITLLFLVQPIRQVSASDIVPPSISIHRNVPSSPHRIKNHIS